MSKTNHSATVAGRKVGVIAQHTTWSGPIPDPASLTEYQKLVPNAAERILSMAEAEALSRRNRIDADHDSENRSKEADMKGYHDGIRRGQFLSFVVIMSCIGSAVFCVLRGANTVAGILAGAGFAGIAAQFIPRRKP